MDMWPGDFSGGGTLVAVMLAVRVEIEGKVWLGPAEGVCGPDLASSQGRWATVASMVQLSGRDCRVAIDQG